MTPGTRPSRRRRRAEREPSGLRAVSASEVVSVEAMMAAAHGSEAGTLQTMTPDEELLVIFGALHLVALVLGVVLFAMFLRAGGRNERRPPEDDEHGGGGGNDRIGGPPKPRPPGGIPLPDAEQAATRLRT